jgi:hypothetical protein
MKWWKCFSEFFSLLLLFFAVRSYMTCMHDGFVRSFGKWKEKLKNVDFFSFDLKFSFSYTRTVSSSVFGLIVITDRKKMFHCISLWRSHVDRWLFNFKLDALDFSKLMKWQNYSWKSAFLIWNHGLCEKNIGASL